MDTIISDSNIFIDMIEGELSEEMFQLPYGVTTPYLLYEEELSHEYSYLIDHGLVLSELDGNDMNRVYELSQGIKSVSIYDCMALRDAEKRECLLLTGDQKLKELALTQHIEVKGTIWLIEQLLINNIISVEKAEDAYNKMRETDRRLPWNKFSELINRYKN
ncbi:MAG: DUF3368 domain-containing protein [gamma proteobacterium symbiont of Taylorina sp.]|nr:DUF3368 domain-containing protein [gamma proteobacterium symbiont of Taylorina sp.]